MRLTGIHVKGNVKGSVKGNVEDNVKGNVNSNINVNSSGNCRCAGNGDYRCGRQQYRLQAGLGKSARSCSRCKIIMHDLNFCRQGSSYTVHKHS
jgi:hypothetical protein